MVPAGAAVVSGIISTSVVLVYGVAAKSAAGLFWSIISFSTVVGLFSYLILFPVYIILRRKDAEVKRPYQAPGPEWFKLLLAIVAELFILMTILVLMIQPGESFWENSFPIIAGALSAVVVGEIIISRCLKSREN